MFKIGEFSKLTQVSIRMLRYYDETGLLTPPKTDPWTGSPDVLRRADTCAEQNHLS